MTYPNRKKLTEYPIVTPTLADSLVNIQGNTVKRSTLQSILTLFSANSPSPTLPYKVFTGRVTQNGGSVFQNRNAGGTLTKGVTYTIISNGGYDFIPLGAPSNTVGTYFICNQTITTGLGIPFDLQFNTGAPVIDILENTIGNIWFTYNGGGNYLINSTGKFTLGKIWAVAGPVIAGTVLAPVVIDSYSGNINYMLIYYLTGGIVPDGYLQNIPIEIRVYN
jgi:hypothetical protein